MSATVRSFRTAMLISLASCIVLMSACSSSDQAHGGQAPFGLDKLAADQIMDELTGDSGLDAGRVAPMFHLSGKAPRNGEAEYWTLWSAAEQYGLRAEGASTLYNHDALVLGRAVAERNVEILRYWLMEFWSTEPGRSTYGRLAQQRLARAERRAIAFSEKLAALGLSREQMDSMEADLLARHVPLDRRP